MCPTIYVPLHLPLRLPLLLPQVILGLMAFLVTQFALFGYLAFAKGNQGPDSPYADLNSTLSDGYMCSTFLDSCEDYFGSIPIAMYDTYYIISR